MDNIKNHHILLDSCIISYLLSNKNELRGKTQGMLSTLRENGNFLYISELTHYEIFKGIPYLKSNIAEKTIEEFEVVTVTRERLKRAAILYGHYKDNPSIQSILHSISDIDIFIGSLIVTDRRPLLLTADYHDFPRPFFKEKQVERIEYKSDRGNFSSLYYYYFEANLEMLW